ncbi:hypothetical protein LXA43DRAFT_172812 [Ganoderma leucocontextum]|nr:hypothetical protein LXA43DRAFT_172812 [Ganoderma leucocontextum]
MLVDTLVGLTPDVQKLLPQAIFCMAAENIPFLPLKNPAPDVQKFGEADFLPSVASWFPPLGVVLLDREFPGLTGTLPPCPPDPSNVDNLGDVRRRGPLRCPPRYQKIPMMI